MVAVGPVSEKFVRPPSAVQLHRVVDSERIFDRLLEVLRDLIINRQLSCVDNSHRQSSFDGVVEKDRMDGFSDGIVAAE